MRLQDSSGIAVDGSKNIKFTFWSASTAGTQLYTACSDTGSPGGTPTAVTVTLTSGTGSVLIGDTANLTCASGSAATMPATLFNNSEIYLGVTVEADSEMTPRKRIVAAGYALNADRLDDLETSSSGGTEAFVPVTDSSGLFRLTGTPTTVAGVITVNPASPAANSLLIDLQNTGSSVFSVDEDGDFLASGSATISGNLSVAHLYPLTDDSYDLGSSARRWRDLYLGPQTLHIGSSDADEGLISYDTSANVLNFSTDATTAGDIAFFTDDLYIDRGTGNVGIGDSTPDAKLDVAGDTWIDGLASIGGNLSLVGNATLAGTLNVDSGTLYVNATNNRVGVGTTSPGWPLDVSAGSSAMGVYVHGTASDLTYPWNNPTVTLRQDTATSNNYSSLSFTNANTNVVALVAAKITNHTASEAGQLSFWTANGTLPTVKMTITESGNVGIGDTTPDALLDVAGDAWIDGLASIAGNLTARGTVTFPGLTNGFLKSTSGVLSGGNSVALGSDVSGTLPVGNGGTGLTSYTTGDILYASGAAALSALPASTAGLVLTSNGAGTAPSWQTVSVTEADTLATVTGRGATTSTLVELNGGFTSTSSATIAGAFNVNSGTLYVDAGSGNVGIGTTSPAQDFVVAGAAGERPTISITTPGTDGNEAVELKMLSEDNNSDGLVDAGDHAWLLGVRGNAYATTEQRNDLFFSYYNGSSWNTTITADYTGNVSIGDTTPDSFFTVGTESEFRVDSSGNVTTSSVTTSGDIAVNSGNLTTSASTLNIGASVTTLNLAGGSGSTGCTINSSGAMACSGGFTGTLTTEADTLATVTGRGASTDTSVALNGGITVDSTNFTVSGTDGRTSIGGGAGDGMLTIESDVTDEAFLAFNPSSLAANDFMGIQVTQSGNNAVFMHFGREYTSDSAFVPQVTIDGSTFSVGIGDLTPDARLDIEGSGAAEGIIVNSTATDGDGYLQFQDAGTAVWTLGWDDGDSDKFKIGTTALGTSTAITANSSGQVGINFSSPAERLELAGDGAAEGMTINATATDGDAFVQFQNFYSPVWTMGFDDGDGDKFKIGTSAIGTSTRLTIDSSGYVGIGDTTPAALLTVGDGDDFQVGTTGNLTTTGTISQTSSVTTTDAFTVTANSLTAGDAIYVSSNTSGCTGGCSLVHADFDPTLNFTATGYGMNVEFANAGTNAAYGIATRIYNARGAAVSSGTDETTGLSVTSLNNQSNTGGSIYVYGGTFSATGSAGGTSTAFAVTANASGADTNYGVYADGAGSGDYDFYADAADGSTAYGQSSSVRWKTNIEEIPDALGMVLAMRGVYYDWDEEHGGRHDMGMIAEEVMEFVPEIVAVDKNAPGFATGMDYGHMTPVLLQAIKGLHGVSMVSDEFGDYRVGPATVASLDTPVTDSRSLGFAGSWWNATSASAEESKFKIINDVSENGASSLSLLNTVGLPSMKVSQDGDLSIRGRLYLSDRGAMQSDSYLYYDSSSPLGGYVRTNAAGFGTGSYDFAETFPSSDELSAGELVMVDVTVDEHVRRANNSSTSNGYLLAGIVSTRPGFLAGVTDVGHYPVALQGRVPTRVNLENGPIRIGDPIAISSTPGEGMRADAQSYVVGIALQNYDPSTSPKQSEGDMITVFLKVGWFNGETVEAQAESLAGTITTEITGPVDFKSQPLIGIGAMEGMDGKWSIDSEGRLVTSEVRTDNLVAKKATVEVNDEVQTAGRSRIVTGNSEVRVNNPAVKPNSMVFITFYGGVGGDWWISEKVDGSFVVKLSALATTDLEFEYWVVDLEDNRTVVEEPVIEEEDPIGGSATTAGSETEPPVEEPASAAATEDEPPVEEDVSPTDESETDVTADETPSEQPVEEQASQEETPDVGDPQPAVESTPPEESPATS